MLKYFLVLLSLSVSINTWACDLCNIYLNMEPNDLGSSMGFNYRYRLFQNKQTNYNTVSSNLKHAIGNTVIADANIQEEIFNSYDLWLNYFFYEKWQLYGNISFTDNYYKEDDSVMVNVAGIGDLTLLAKYIAFNTKATDSSDWKFRLSIGGGIQVPIGQYNKTYVVSPSSSAKGNVVYGAPYEELDPHMQAGSGSWDVLLVAEGLSRYKNVGISTNITYQVNTANSNQFKFANRLNLNANAFYLAQIKKFTLAPNLGISYESSPRDEFRGDDYLNSGGKALFLSSGVKFYFKKFALGATYFKPIRQSLYDNQLNNKLRTTVDLTYYF